MNSKLLFRLFKIASLILFTQTIMTGDKVWWGIFAPLEISTMTATDGQDHVALQGESQIHMKANSGDCYRLLVNPNGTLRTEWEVCPS